MKIADGIVLKDDENTAHSPIKKLSPLGLQGFSSEGSHLGANMKAVLISGVGSRRWQGFAGVGGKTMAKPIESARVCEMPQATQPCCPEIEKIKKSYGLREPELILPFLSKNKTLVTIISSFYENIRKEFPVESIILEAVSDFQLSTEKEIVISISTSLSVDEANECLDRVKYIKWDKKSKDPRVNICLKLEYQ